MQELNIHDEIAAFIEAKSGLVNIKADPWVVFAEAKFQKRFSSFEDAYSFAACSFPSGKFLIRNVHAPDPFLPMMYVAQ